MTQAHMTVISARHPAGERLLLKIGGVCTIVGAVAFIIVRTLHGDTPAADPQASLDFVASRPIYAGMHVGAIFAALLTLTGLIALAGSLTQPPAWALGRLGVASSLVGAAIFSVEGSSEGLALSELARARAGAPPQDQAELVGAAHAVLIATHGPSLVAIAVLYGLPLVLVGSAMVMDTYPSWIGWAGMIIGAATVIAATGQFLQPDLMPGVVIYGLLASVLAQLWFVALAVAMLRRARRTA
jgi:hypothetical protein